jgi:hypothetical protein
MTAFDLKEMTLKAAKMAHEVNRNYCRMLGDDSQPHWEMAPDWQRQSAIVGVQAILKNPMMTPDESHASWMEHKKADGWVYGPEKNVERKEHPCMVSYSQLPITQRFKDYLFQSVVRASLALE